MAYLGVGLGGPVPYQRGLVNQSPKSRYSNRAVSNSNKAVTVIKSSLANTNYESYKINKDLVSGELSIAIIIIR